MKCKQNFCTISISRENLKRHFCPDCNFSKNQNFAPKIQKYKQTFLNLRQFFKITRRNFKIVNKLVIIQIHEKFHNLRFRAKSQNFKSLNKIPRTYSFHEKFKVQIFAPKFQMFQFVEINTTSNQSTPIKQ